MSNQFGEKLKQLREENNLLQRHVASMVDIDTPLFSKIERGERIAKKSIVIKLAKIFKVGDEELLTLWLADQVLEVIKDEAFADEALKSVSSTINSKKK